MNIFTDASCKEITTSKGKFNITCPGFIATFQGRIAGSGLEVYIDESSVFGEAKGVELAVNFARHFSSRYTNFPCINIFTDNLTVMNRIADHLKDWFDSTDDQYKMSVVQGGLARVVNWEHICYNSALMIFTSNVPIRVLYTPGHVNIFVSPPPLKDAVNKTVKHNVKSHGDLAEEIKAYVAHDSATFNNMVDLMTRNFLFYHRPQIEQDIDNAGDRVCLGEDKFFPVRWPLAMPNNPVFANPSMRSMMLLN